MRALRFAGRAFWIAGLLLVSGLVWLAGWLVLLVTLRGRARRQAWFAGRLAWLLAFVPARPARAKIPSGVVTHMTPKSWQPRPAATLRSYG